MALVRSIIGTVDDSTFPPHGTPVGEFQEAAMAGEIVKVVTNADRPLQSVKMYRQAATAYIKANPGAYIMDEPPVADNSSQDTVTKMVGPMEDKSIDGPSIPRKVKAK